MVKVPPGCSGFWLNLLNDRIEGFRVRPYYNSLNNYATEYYTTGMNRLTNFSPYGVMSEYTDTSNFIWTFVPVR